MHATHDKCNVLSWVGRILVDGLIINGYGSLIYESITWECISIAEFIILHRWWCILSQINGDYELSCLFAILRGWLRTEGSGVIFRLLRHLRLRHNYCITKRRQLYSWCVFFVICSKKLIFVDVGVTLRRWCGNSVDVKFESLSLLSNAWFRLILLAVLVFLWLSKVLETLHKVKHLCLLDEVLLGEVLALIDAWCIYPETLVSLFVLNYVLGGELGLAAEFLQHVRFRVIND
jgi:hypothetical protein